MARDAVVMWAVSSSPLLLGTCLIEMRRRLIVFHNPSQAKPIHPSFRILILFSSKPSLLGVALACYGWLACPAGRGC